MESIVPLLHCSKCSNDWPPTPDYWYVNTTAKSGFRSPCKMCTDAEYQTRTDKWCPGCKNTLPVSAFSPVKTRFDGRSAYCTTCRRKKQKENHAAHPEKRRANALAYYHENPEKKRTDQAKLRRNLRMAALVHYGGNPPSCACCGELHIEFLAIDHVANNGAAHRREIGGDKTTNGSIQVLRWLRDNGYPEGFQVLCFNCNYAKHVYKICPHQLK